MIALGGIFWLPGWAYYMSRNASAVSVATLAGRKLFPLVEITRKLQNAVSVVLGGARQFWVRVTFRAG
jgi:hypothetical protein